MTLLTIDTSGSVCSVAVSNLKTGQILGYISEEIGRGHAERLMNDIDLCLSSAGLSFDNLEKIAVVKGPGSFTGVRVGMAAAKGLAIALNLPLVGVSMLDALAAKAREYVATDRIAVLLDAKRGQAYCQIENEKPFLEMYDAFKERLADHNGVFCGSGCLHLPSDLLEQVAVIHGLSQAPIETIASLAATIQTESAPVTPLYIRGADAKVQSGFALRKRQA